VEIWALVLLFGVLVEAIIQVVKGWLPDAVIAPGWLWPVASAVTGIILSFAAGVDALSALGVEITAPFVGQVVTGLLVSRGSNFIHDLWKRIKNSNVET
jgi:hypothetical protein